MANIISSAGLVFNGVIANVGTVASTIVNTPLLLVFCVLPLIGLGVGMFRRLMSVN